MQNDELKTSDTEKAALSRDQMVLDATNATTENSKISLADSVPGMIRVSTIEYWSAVEGDLATAKIKNEIAFGADVNASSEMGYTPLHAAAENNRIANARLLLQFGANIDAVTDDGQTPLDFAMLSGNVEMIQFLKSYQTEKRTNI